VARNLALPERLPSGGAAILRDGDPGAPQATMSPLEYHYRHRAEVDLIFAGPDQAARDAGLDTLTQWLGNAIASDRTLGGLCDWVEAEAPAPQEVAMEGAEPIKAATVIVVLHYAAPDPLL
jgi:hypothetical protein